MHDFELHKVSDREATLRVNTCPVLKRVRRLVEKTGVEVDPKFICEVDSKMLRGVAKEFGIHIVTELTENGCMNTVKPALARYIF